MEIKFEEFKEVFCKSLSDSYSVDEINEVTKVFDLKVDSLDMMQIIFDIEIKFKIKVDDTIYNNLNTEITLKDLYDNILKFQMS
jgi:acyl carrier protein